MSGARKPSVIDASERFARELAKSRADRIDAERMLSRIAEGTATWADVDAAPQAIRDHVEAILEQRFAPSR